MKTFYITTPIYYVNDVPHIGHAYTTIAADVLARFRRLCGDDVFFLTGLDEHGQKVQQAALKAGTPPQEYVDQMVPRFQDLWKILDISHDDFVRTTQERHTRVVQRVLTVLKDRGEIYRDTYEGWYCLPDERFWTEKDVVDGNCPECGRPVERITEHNYFFRMGKYQEALRKHILDHPDFIRPKSRRNEVLGFLEKPLEDLCISRPKVRLSWGIPLPFDPDFVTYVWLDALVNYISIPGYEADASRFMKWWPADVHLLGKDILTTHAVYWGTLLMALGLELPITLFAHGWWTSEGEKMSKSRGNVVDPYQMVQTYGVSSFRYFLFREVPFGLDGDFSQEALRQRANSELANDFGNLVSRTLTMIERYAAGRIPSVGTPDPSPEAKAIHEIAGTLVNRFDEALHRQEFHKALAMTWELVTHTNRYIDHRAPWTLAKDPGQQGLLQTVLYTCAESLRYLCILLSPFMPDAARQLADQLGLPEDYLTRPLLRPDAIERTWGALPPGLLIHKGASLFPRMGPSEEAFAPSKNIPMETTMTQEKNMQPSDASHVTFSQSVPEITIDEFGKIDLRTGRVLSAERVEKSKKLLKLQVDLGREVRQIVAGIATRYTPEEITGKTVVIVANLKPATLMGVQSQGMVLAAGGAEVLSLLTVGDETPPGTKVK